MKWAELLHRTTTTEVVVDALKRDDITVTTTFGGKKAVIHSIIDVRGIYLAYWSWAGQSEVYTDALMHSGSKVFIITVKDKDTEKQEE